MKHSVQDPAIRRGLDALLRPRSIVLVGATPETTSLAGGFLRNLVRGGYAGAIYPVNPKYERIGDLRCYPDLQSLPAGAPLDLAVLLVGANRVLPFLAACGQAGIGAAIILSANFGETGDDEGRRRQAELAEIVRGTGIRVCGPNSLGVIHQGHNLVAFGSLSVPERLPHGRLAVVSQSGGLATLVYNRHRPLGFSHLISAGNQDDLEIGDYIAYLAEDPAVGAIAAFVEGVRTADGLIAGCRRAAALGKPVVMLKIGRSEVGAAAAVSHTGSLTGSDAAWDALLGELGVIRVKDPDELFEVAHCLAAVPPAASDGVAIATLSGGVAGILGDLAADHGVRLPAWGSQSITDLKALGYHVFGNPFDANGLIPIHPERLCQSLDILAREPAVGVLMAALPPASGRLGEALARDLVALRDRVSQPLITVWPGGEPSGAGLEVLRSAGVPCFGRMDTAILAARALVATRGLAATAAASQASLVRPAGVPAPGDAAVAGLLSGSRGAPLTEAAGKRVLAAYGIPVTRERLAADADTAAGAATAIGFPVVLKIHSPDITHKSDAGGVRLGLADAAAVRVAYEEVVASARAYDPAARIEGVLVQEQVTGGVEAFIGGYVDPQLGPFVVFGLGGIFVEVFKNVLTRPAPLTRAAAEAMVRGSQGWPVLSGARGQMPADVEALADTLVRVSWLLCDWQSEVAELDINPVAVLPREKGGIRALDARIVLR